MVAGFLAGWLENMIMNTPFVWGFRLEVPVRFRKNWLQKPRYETYIKQSEIGGKRNENYGTA